MNRKEFFKRGILGMGTIIGLPTVASSCKEAAVNPNCPTTPTEIAGPFPIKSPADMVRENIIGNRTGVALRMDFTIQNINDDCNVLQGVYVDVWQCDAKGNYSEYSGQIEGDFTSENFLRGRQSTDSNGQASFLTIYPGWYPGRAPHIHLEVLDNAGKSLLVTQVAFPENVSQAVYAMDGYNGDADTSNNRDGSFRDSLNENIADSVTGNTTDGYVLTKVIKVDA